MSEFDLVGVVYLAVFCVVMVGVMLTLTFVVSMMSRKQKRQSKGEDQE